jgi:hypothetical protein
MSRPAADVEYRKAADFPHETEQVFPDKEEIPPAEIAVSSFAIPFLSAQAVKIILPDLFFFILFEQNRDVVDHRVGCAAAAALESLIPRLNFFSAAEAAQDREQAPDVLHIDSDFLKNFPAFAVSQKGRRLHTADPVRAARLRSESGLRPRPAG